MKFARHAELYSLPLPIAGFRRHQQQKTARQMEDYLCQARQSFAAAGGRAPGRCAGAFLKITGKLLRFFQRRHAFATRQKGTFNRIVFSGRREGWQLRQR
jgi:hypothetical protein